MKLRSLLSASSLTVLFGLGSFQPALAAPQYATVAAKYQTTSCALPCEKSRSGEWYLWRDENRVEIRAGSGRIGEIWRRDGQGRINFTYVEPAHKRGIEYTPTDLKLLGNERAWSKLASIVSPADLEKLTAGGETEILGHKALRYQGIMDKRTVEVIWIPSLQLAARVSHTYADRQVTTELQAFMNDEKGIDAISDQELKSYQLIDYADVGDNETNPAMAWLKRSAAPGHEHHHH